MPLVSVIVNVRNGASTLAEALNSVMAQTFQDWELIVWDDCSTDESANIVGQYADPRIRYFRSSEDVSLGKARQRAIGIATGECVAFLDQDDIWLPHKLEKQLALMEAGVGFVYGRTVRFYPSGLERDYDQSHEFQLLPEGDIFSELFVHSCFPAMSSAVFRSTALEVVGGIPDAIDIIPDYWLYVAVARRFPVRAVQEVVCRYRMHAGSMSRTHGINMHTEALWLVGQWAGTLDRKTAALCQRRHQTAIAMEEMHSSRSLRCGIQRLISEGSLRSILLRPFLFLFHLIRRNVRQPYWKKFGRTCGTTNVERRMPSAT
jgi:glycosyltransferase involved in cell wall biosynthesis